MTFSMTLLRVLEWITADNITRRLEYYEFGDRNTHMGTWSGPMTERAARDFLVSELKPWIGADTELKYLNNVSDFYPELREAAEHLAARRKLEQHLDGGNKQDLPHLI